MEPGLGTVVSVLELIIDKGMKPLSAFGFAIVAWTGAVLWLKPQGFFEILVTSVAGLALVGIAVVFGRLVWKLTRRLQA